MTFTALTDSFPAATESSAATATRRRRSHAPPFPWIEGASAPPGAMHGGYPSHWECQMDSAGSLVDTC
jgi:hypothetical protein